MSKYDLVLFDLDGTLSQSHGGVKASLIYALNQIGKPIPTEIDDPTNYIGPLLMDTLTGMCGLSEEDAERAADEYKEIYNSQNKYDNKCYDGINEVLRTLKARGVKLGVATTKYEPFAEEVLRILGIIGYFDIISGTSGDGKISTKAQVITAAKEKLKIKETDKVVLIGDSKFDTEGALSTKIDFIGVNYGYGRQEDMQALGASVFVDKAIDLLQIL